MCYLNVMLGWCYVDVLWCSGVCEVDVFGYCLGGLVVFEMVKLLV